MEDEKRKLEEAKKKYSIMERIRNATAELEEAQKNGDKQKILRERNKIKQLNKEVENYATEARDIIITGKRPSKDKTLIIVGGQSGAGKSRLVPAAKRELQNNAVVVDFDELRSYHPAYETCNEEHPETTHAILHEDTEFVKNAILKGLCKINGVLMIKENEILKGLTEENEILKGLIEKNYNVIYEGALRNTKGFLDFAQAFRDNDYNIRMMIMAVPALESYGSTFFRYALALHTNKTPRWVEKYAHDGSYEGVLRTVQAFKEQNLVDNIGVYVRSKGDWEQLYKEEKQELIKKEQTGITLDED